MMIPLLCLKNISYQISSKQAPILDNLSLDVYPGQCLVILGANGSGKSSLIKAINGLIQPSKGTISFQGKDLLQIPLHRRSREIVTITQDLNFSTFSDLTVMENCLIALERGRPSTFFGLFSLSHKRQETFIAALLYRYNPKLYDKRHQTVSSLSGGERQLLAFALSLSNDPLILLADEHTSATDPSIGQMLMQMTHTSAEATNRATIITTHNLAYAQQYGHRLVLINRGKIVFDVTGREKQRLAHDELLALYSSHR